MYFFALADFNLSGQSILLVCSYQQESDDRKPGIWIFGFSKGLPSHFRLPTDTEISFLLPNCDPPACHTDETQNSLPNRNSWEWSHFGGRRWCHWLNHIAIHLDEKTVTASLSSRKWNGTFALTTSNTWYTILKETKGDYVCLQSCQHPKWKGVTSIKTRGKSVSIGHRYTPIAVCRHCIHTQRTHFSWIYPYEFLSVNLKIHIMTLLVNIYLAVPNM